MGYMGSYYVIPKAIFYLLQGDPCLGGTSRRMYWRFRGGGGGGGLGGMKPGSYDSTITSQILEVRV